MDLNTWVRELRSLLAELKTLDLGYEFGINDVRAPAAVVPESLPQRLRTMYRAFDGLSMPDVHNGYFIDASARAVTAEARGLPTRVSGAPQLHIHVFGSDGGGGLFAIDTRVGTFFYLPSDGAVSGGTFAQSELVRVRRIAGDVNEFLERLLNDVRAFVEGREDYRYMTDWSPADPLN